MKQIFCICLAMGIAHAAAGQESAPTATRALTDCAVVDMWSTMDDTTKSILEMAPKITGEAHDASWMKRVRVCRAGRYSVLMPADGDSDHIFFYTSDGLAMTLNGGQMMIFERNKRFVATLEDKDLNGTVDFVNYSTKPTPPDGDTEVWDRDADGCPDMKFTTAPDGSLTRLVNIAGRWCEFVKRGKKWGYTLDGKFYPTRKARTVAIEESLNECAQRSGSTAN